MMLTPHLGERRDDTRSLFAASCLPTGEGRGCFRTDSDWHVSLRGLGQRHTLRLPHSHRGRLAGRRSAEDSLRRRQKGGGRAQHQGAACSRRIVICPEMSVDFHVPVSNVLVSRPRLIVKVFVEITSMRMFFVLPHWGGIMYDGGSRCG